MSVIRIRSKVFDADGQDTGWFYEQVLDLTTLPTQDPIGFVVTKTREVSASVNKPPAPLAGTPPPFPPPNTRATPFS